MDVSMTTTSSRRIRSRVTQGGKLSDALFRPSAVDFANFAALPSNVRAVESSLLFANGLLPFVALVGPSGWGKTHLLACVSEVSKRRFGYEPITLSVPELQQDDPRLELPTPLLLDNGQAVLRNPRAKHRLRLALEHRIRSGKPTLIVFEQAKLSRWLKAFLPCTRLWSWSEIVEPTFSERALIVRRMAASLGVMLSDRLIWLMARYLPGNGQSLRGNLLRLSIVDSEWLTEDREHKALGLVFGAGVALEGWDLRDVIHEAVEVAARSFPEIAPNDVLNLAVYVMAHRFGIREEHVAGYFGLTTGQAYFRHDQMIGHPLTEREDLEDAWIVAFNHLVDKGHH